MLSEDHLHLKQIFCDCSYVSEIFYDYTKIILRHEFLRQLLFDAWKNEVFQENDKKES